MVQIDWKKMMTIMPESMSEHDKDDLYETVAWNLPDYNTNRKQLIHFVRITQEILKHKSEQVDSLMNELDDIAAKQGEEEAKDRQELLNEIYHLKEQLEHQRRLGQENDHATLSSNEELRSEIVKLEMHNKELVLELQEREKDLMKEKIEVENYASQVVTLQREKEELKKELAALQEEAQEKMNGKSLHDSFEFGPEKQEELTDLIRQKNKHITQLLDDLDILEKQNLTLKTKLANVCDELSDATNHISEMTMHLSQMKHINEELERKLIHSEEKNRSLMGQIDELTEEKAKHDKQLDEFSEQLNAKVQDWNEALKAKDMQICKAEEEIKRLIAGSSKFPEYSNLEMNEKVVEQEQQIINLKNELLRATSEINNCTEMIESFKEKKSQLKFTDIDQYQAQIMMYEQKIKDLEEKLRYAEEDAHAKAEEISEVVILLREYEMGEFGLSEAMNRIKQLERILEKRELQIEKLVESCNNMEIEFENLEQRNMALRERLGMSADEEIDTTTVKLKYRKDLEVIENLKFQLDKKEEELIKSKLKCRKLIKLIKLKSKIAEGSPSSLEESREEQNGKEFIQVYADEKSSLENKLGSVIKENDALRKGMHEILESIQNQDSAGTIEIQSHCLERLLEALDSRHVSGWYHPAMRLQALLNNAEGKNEELRNQIRSIRKEEKSKSSELQDAYEKIHSLENQLFILQTPREDVESKSRTPDSELEEVELEANDKPTPNIEQENIIALEIELQEMKHSLNKTKIELEKLEHTRSLEKEEFSSKIFGLEKQISSLESHVDGQVVDCSRLESQVCVQERQINFLRKLESTERAENERLYKEILDQEKKFLQEILRLQNDKFTCVLKVEKLEKELLQSVPKSKLNNLSKELKEVTMKYQDAVALGMSVYEDSSVERLEEEVGLLQKEKNEVLNELRIAKEKLLSREDLSKEDKSSCSCSEELAIVSEKLAASEVRELNEKQKAAHLEKVNLTLKSELQDLEAYNKEMMRFITDLKEMKKKFEDIWEKITKPVEDNEEEYSVLREKVEKLTKKLKIAENDKENFRELFEISQDQFKSLERYKEKEKLKVTNLYEQLLLLQSVGDEKATVARLSHELLTCKLSSSQLSEEKDDLQNRVTKLLAKNLVLEAKIEEAQQQDFSVKRKHFADLENLHKIISDLRKMYGTFIMFPNLEIIYKMKKRLKVLRDEERNCLKKLKNEIREYSIKKQEFDIKTEGLEELIAAFKGDAKQLMAWYNRGTSLRLEEARCRRQNQFLSVELEQLENYVKKMDEEIISLEESNLAREKEWEQRQLLWEESQKEMLESKQEKSVENQKEVTVHDEATETSQFDDNLEQMKKIVEDQAETIERYKTEMRTSEAEIKQLKRNLNEKEIPTNEKFEKKGEIESDEAEKAALKVTVQSLENIIRQKEETIYKYQELLKEGRDEYSKSSGKFQEELRTLHDALTKQSKAYAKLKNSLDGGHHLKDGLPKIFEKYLTKIHELEDDLAESQMTLAGVNGQLFSLQQEKEKWRTLAEERLSFMDDMRQRLELNYNNELENYKTDIEKYLLEIERLKRCMETIQHDSSGDQRKPFAEIDIQEKECQFEVDSAKEQEVGLTEKMPKNRDYVKEIKVLERQLKFAKDESSRLREQLKLSQSQKSKRAKTASSITSRSGSDSKSSLKEESLQSKVKTLEELLKIAKDREQDLIEGNQRRIKSAEEVARWGERKKSQLTVQNLNAKLKEKEAEIDMLKNKNESFRNMIHKCERDRNALELQLKSAKGGPSSLTSRLNKLMEDKSRLEKEVDELRNKLEIQHRHEGGVGAAVLYDKLESQERKLAVLELATKGRSTVAEELEKLQTSYCNLEKNCLKLESENLALHLRLEKEKSTIKRLTEQKSDLEKRLMVAEEESEMRQQESNRTISSLNEKIGKLSDVKKNGRIFPSSRSTICPEKLRKDYSKLKEDHKALRAKYLEVVDKNLELEEELKKCRYQIRLLEEKDLADSISKTNSLQLTSQLSQELLQVKAQLNHKTHLLNRVKVLLTKAAAKEKALNEKVSALQNMVPAVIGEV